MIAGRSLENQENRKIPREPGEKQTTWGTRRTGRNLRNQERRR